MGIMGMKYGFSTRFHHERTFSIKLKANRLSFEMKLDIF
jgi:hypothetical protein